MTPVEWMLAFDKAIEVTSSRSKIPGDIVECGVWRGGSSRLAAATLMALGSSHRTLFLFDTFEGMPAPGLGRRPALDRGGSRAASSTAPSARRMSATNGRTPHFPGSKRRWRRLPTPASSSSRAASRTLCLSAAPPEIALLRLDTDWYESTRHELEHLYPRLVDGGVLIVDDYGYWQGARQAVDEYFGETGEANPAEPDRRHGPNRRQASARRRRDLGAGA